MSLTSPPRPPLLPGQPLYRFALLVGLWGAITLVVLAHSYLVLRVRGFPMTAPTLVASALHGLSWIALAPVVAWLARRFPLGGKHGARNLGLHLLTALVLNVVTVAGIVAVASFFGPEPVTFRTAFVFTFLSSFFFFFLLYAAVAATVLAIEHAQRARERTFHAARLETEAAQLESQLAHAQLEALRMQLNPHFLFNTLHAVSALMGRDVSTARTVLADLSDLLRLSLDHIGENELPLEDELAFLRHYLRIERTRFRDRLCIEEEIAPETRGALVPSLLLQPLVENAIKHGVAPRGEGGHVTVSARRDSGYLVLAVADDGPGVPPGDKTREGVGLRNTRARLAKLYGPDHAFTLRNRSGGGLVAEVRLPFHTTPLDRSPVWTPPSV